MRFWGWGSKRHMNKRLLEKIKFQLEGHREVILSSSITLAEGRALGHDLRGDGLCGLRLSRKPGI